MANNVNCKEMIFVIGYLIDVADVSLTKAPENSCEVGEMKTRGKWKIM